MINLPKLTLNVITFAVVNSESSLSAVNTDQILLIVTESLSFQYMNMLQKLELKNNITEVLLWLIIKYWKIQFQLLRFFPLTQKLYKIRNSTVLDFHSLKLHGAWTKIIHLKCFIHVVLKGYDSDSSICSDCFSRFFLGFQSRQRKKFCFSSSRVSLNTENAHRMLPWS